MSDIENKRIMGMPERAPSNLLMYSIHVCLALKCSVIVLVMASPNIRSFKSDPSEHGLLLACQRVSFAMTIWPSAYSAPCFQVIWSSEVGGISNPKHLGQSGQPIPDPVIRTMSRRELHQKTRVNAI